MTLIITQQYIKSNVYMDWLYEKHPPFFKMKKKDVTNTEHVKNAVYI